MTLSSAEFDRMRRSLRKLSPFTDRELEIFVQGLERVDVPRKSYVAEAGKVCRSLGYMLSGSVRYFRLKDGEEITGYFSLEGEWIGSYQSFLRQCPGDVYIEALENTTVLLFSYDQMRAWENDPEFSFRINHFFRKLAEYIITCYEDRVAAFVLQSPEERYLDMLKSGEAINRIPQQYIANYLGITPVSLSRIRRRILV